MSISGVVSGEIHCSCAFLLKRTSPDELLCGTCCRSDGSSVTSRIESRAEHISFDLADDSMSTNAPSIDEGVEISTGSSLCCLPGR